MDVAGKIASVEETVRRVRTAQTAGRTVVLCHGCFDIVHPGHIRHLQHAAKQGDRLLVTLTGDAVVGKGAARPLIPQELRAESLAALDCVDWVTVNRRPTAAELLEEIRPDVYVKGAEYEQNLDPRFQLEKQVVERYGGRVVFTSGDVVFSSTALIAALEETASEVHSTLRRLIEKHDVSPATVGPIIEAFQGRRVLVIGEVVTDTYVMCDRPDVAGEGPLMTLRPLEYRSFDGGAAIVAKHLAALGARPTLLTALPDFPQAEAMRQRLTIDGVQTHWISTDSPIVEKQRFLVGATKMMKLDLGRAMVFDAASRRELVGLAGELARTCDGVIVSDYGLGLFTSTVLGQLCRTLRPLTGLLVGDASGRRSSLPAMREMDLIAPTELEMRAALHQFDEGLSSVVWNLLCRTESRAAVVTLGEEGLIVFDRREGEQANGGDWASRLTAEHVPSFAANVVDQLGCGDVLTATATLSLLVGASLPMAAMLGSVAAAAEGQKLGNAIIGAADLRRGVQRLIGAQLTYQAEPAASLVSGSGDQLRAANS
ncbi:MAG: adenylyltransferase/cytidyltransferase family protein [Phycisphaerales bacterium]|nr:MAG: adenylyltransferase/cytidyltransferase family protein [Phycisphaerales bacterium]